MGTSLSGLTPKDTYPALLKTADNTVINSTLKTISDGAGDDTVLQLSTLRVGIKSDSTVTTQTSSVIQATTTNANLVIAPNGTGALVASIPDGTATGGNARNTYAVDLQMSRTVSTQVASGNSSAILGGERNTANSAFSVVLGGRLNQSTGTSSVSGGDNSNVSGSSSIGIGSDLIVSGANATAFGRTNTVSSQYSTVSGGQSNTASTGTHATVVGGASNTASGQHSVAGGSSNTASGLRSVAFGESSTALGSRSFVYGQSSTASGINSVAIGGVSSVASGPYSTALSGIGNQSTKDYTLSQGYLTTAYLQGQTAFSGTVFASAGANCQQSNLVANKEADLTTAATTVLSLDGTGVTNLIIPLNNNRAWNVQVNWVAIVTTITGTATGITVGDTITQVQTLGFKRIGGTSSLIGTANTLSTNANPSMSTASMAYSAGGSQEMAITFTAPTFAGAGSITCRVVARIELTEVAY